MDYREKAFADKFSSAAKGLGCTPQQIVSLKVRENIGDHHSYTELLHELEHQAGLKSASIQGGFMGQAYLVENSKTKVIIVEHESGLEILYILGSVASLVSLIPMILQGWSYIRKHHLHAHQPPDFQRIETRYFNEKGHLVEDHANALTVPWASPLSMANTALLTAAESIDAEIQQLRGTVNGLMVRMETLEKAVEIKPNSKVKKTKQKTSK